MTTIIPPYLVPGHTIRIVATARKIVPEALDHAVKLIESRGYNVQLGGNLSCIENQFAGTDAQRAQDLADAFADPDVKAVFCFRGGYGSVRIVDTIDWDSLNGTPKWIVGYSDVTVLHARAHQLGFSSIHGTMPINYEANSSDSISGVFDLLEGKSLAIQSESHSLNRPGKAQGQLVGGNLSILYSLLGSQDQLDTKGKILLLEDLDEYLYHVDRMMQALDRAGMLNELSGLVVGGMTDMNDNDIPFGQSAEEIIRSVVDRYDYPVAFGYPIGHLDHNLPVMLGAEYSLQVDNGSRLGLNNAK